MAKYSYAGEFVNPTKDFFVMNNPEGEGYIIGVKLYCDCGAPCCKRPEVGSRPHDTHKIVYDEIEDAEEWIESLSESFEEDYDRYLDENRYELAQMERYEQWRNEY